MCSTVAFAAEAADDRPRASMMAAPRLATVGMKVDSIQASSFTSSAAFFPPTSAWKMSGYWVEEWLPQMVIFLTSSTGRPSFWASWVFARLWSRRVRALKRSFGMSGALLDAISALVLAGLPVTSTRTSSAATSFNALPWAVKMAPLALSRSPRSMPALRGMAPTSITQVGTVEDLLRIIADDDVLQVREGTVVEFHDDTLQGLQGRGDFQQTQLDGPITQQGAAGYAKQQAVADLAGGAGDRDLDGSLSAHRADLSFDGCFLPRA